VKLDQWLEMWAIQKEQQKDFQLDPKLMSPSVMELEVKNMILGMNEELGKLSKHVGNHKSYATVTAVDRYNLAEDCVDILKYLVVIAQLFGLEPLELFEVFQEKTKVVKDKVRRKSLALGRDTPVVLVDIDNVISDLSIWDENVAEHSNIPVNQNTVSMIERLKGQFYHDGGFRDLDPVPGAVEGMKTLASRGWKLVLLSARPYWSYKRLYADTLYWLDKHEIPHDLLIFNKDKAEAIYENVFPSTPAFMLEDRHKHAVEVAKYGVPVLLLDWQYNRDVGNTDMITRVSDWTEIVALVGHPKRKKNAI